MQKDNATIPTVSLEYLYEYISGDYATGDVTGEKKLTGDELIFLAWVDIKTQGDPELFNSFGYGGNLDGTKTADEKSVGVAITLRDAVENHNSSSDFDLEEIYLDSLYLHNTSDDWETWGSAYGTDEVEIKLLLLLADNTSREAVSFDIMRSYIDEDGEPITELVKYLILTPDSEEYHFDVSVEKRYYTASEETDEGDEGTEEGETYTYPYSYFIKFREEEPPPNNYHIVTPYSAGDAILLTVMFSPSSENTTNNGGDGTGDGDDDGDKN